MKNFKQTNELVDAWYPAINTGIDLEEEKVQYGEHLVNLGKSLVNKTVYGVWRDSFDEYYEPN